MEEEVSTSAEVDGEATGSGPTFFTPPQLSTSTHLTTFSTIIPAFGQRRAPVLMTPPTEAVVPPTVTEVAPQALTDDVPRTMMEVVPQTVTNVVPPSVAESLLTAVAEVIPIVSTDVTVAVTPRAQLPPPHPEPQVRLEVNDCDAVVTVSSSFLAEAELAQPVPETNMELPQFDQPEDG